LRHKNGDVELEALPYNLEHVVDLLYAMIWYHNRQVWEICCM